MPAWKPNFRSKIAIRSSATKYYIDPSIATAALGIGPKDLSKDIETLGLMFEALCVRDLRVYANSLGGNVYHYRESKGVRMRLCSSSKKWKIWVNWNQIRRR